MFGYVKLDKPAITMGEYEQYRGVYCTLCRRLGKRYGLIARMSLSYDMTFLALMRLATGHENPDFCPGRCRFNPTKRCLRCRSTDAIDEAADISVLMTYYKIKDTLADEGFWKRLGAGLLLPVFKLYRKRAVRRRPDADRALAAMMESQTAAEQRKAASLDEAADPFAGMLATLMSAGEPDENQRRVLNRFGYCLGRWVYLTDAADDRAEDARRDRYNPYRYARPNEGETENTWIEHSLNANLAECIAAYELLNITRFDGILRNILTRGMPAVEQRVCTEGETV